ncbi:hypothetical protein ACFLY4_00555 [Chloroflexota bacterium]
MTITIQLDPLGRANQTIGDQYANFPEFILIPLFQLSEVIIKITILPSFNYVIDFRYGWTSGEGRDDSSGSAVGVGELQATASIAIKKETIM